MIANAGPPESPEQVPLLSVCEKHSRLMSLPMLLLEHGIEIRLVSSN